MNPTTRIKKSELSATPLVSEVFGLDQTMQKQIHRLKCMFLQRLKQRRALVFAIVDQLRKLEAEFSKKGTRSWNHQSGGLAL